MVFFGVFRMYWSLFALSVLLILVGCGAAPDVKLVPIDPPQFEEVAAQPLAGQAYVPGAACYNDRQLAQFFAADSAVWEESPPITIGGELNAPVRSQWVYRQAKLIKNCREVVDIPLSPANRGHPFTKEGENAPKWILDELFVNQPVAIAKFPVDETFAPGIHYLFVYTCNEQGEGGNRALDCHHDRWVVQKLAVSER